MSEDKGELLLNVFPFNFVFNNDVKDLDFFQVEGAFPRTEKYSLLGDVIYQLEFTEKASLAKYFPTEEEDFVIGFLKKEPKQTEFSVGGMSVTYKGKQSLPPTNMGRRTLLELIYNIQRRNLEEKKYWRSGHDTMFPWTWENLYLQCKRKLNVFRGPHFRYYILSDGRLILVLDTKTHYISSESFLGEVYGKGKDLKWFEEEITEREKAYEQRRRKFRGIYFHYVLTGRSVGIDGVDPRPISDIPIETIIDGKPWRGSVYDFLKTKYPYNKRVQKLDPIQPGVCKGKFTYAPQMLHRHLTQKDVPRNVLNEKTFLLDTTSEREDRDPHYPARMRWEYLGKELESNFRYIDVGSEVYKASDPLTTPINSLRKPRLLVQQGGPPVEPERLVYALRKGAYKKPDTDEIFLFSIDDKLSNPFWSLLEEFLESSFGWAPPDKPTPVETSESEIRNYLQRRRAEGTLGRGICVAIVDEELNLHDMLNNLFGEFGIPVQCVRGETVISIIDLKRFSFLEGLCAGIFVKAGGIPWLLYDFLSYDRYIAVDVGRQLAECWAMGIVYDKQGRYEILPGEMIVGEDLNVESLRSCVSRAFSSEIPKSLVLLRDGDVSKGELQTFIELTGKPDIQNCAIVSIKKNVPHRIFRKVGEEVLKPLSGDYVKLDDNLFLICLAGVDEYSHGTPRPKVVEVISTKGEIDPEKITRDVFYLSYLNWGSPRHSYSSPAPLKLAHQLASELSRGIRPAGPPF